MIPRIVLTAFSITLIPLRVSAAQPTDFKSFVDSIIDILDLFIVALFALAFLMFIIGVVKTWILHGDDAKEVENGKKIIIASIIGFVVMISVWGIVELIQSGLFL